MSARPLCGSRTLESSGDPWTSFHVEDQMSALARSKILVVEEEPLIALDVKAALEDAGATVISVPTRAVADIIKNQHFSAAILDLQPRSGHHRLIARALRQRGIPFLFHSTHTPADVTTVRGAPVVLKPANVKDLVKAVTLLLR
jgi:DNA-binding response OmpR family regulator